VAQDVAAPQDVLHAVTAGFFCDRQINRIVTLAGYDVRFGVPRGANGQMAVWGRTRYSRRGLRLAAWRGARVLTFEDGFLRSVLTGRSGESPQGVVIDRTGIYFDCNRPSDLENILNYTPLDGPEMVSRAQLALAAYGRAGLSKYNNFDPSIPLPATDYVLVIDQTRGDASIRLGGADAGTFAAMLAAARAENPGKTILIKTHPEVVARQRRGHFGRRDADSNTRLVTAPLSPRRLLEGATRVYCVTSLMGFEAILAGHRPRVFGRPFYGGWGLSDDERTFDRRERRLSVGELFTGAMLLYPTWYDIYRDRLCGFETVVQNLEAQARARREDCHGYMAMGMRLWKRRHLRRFFRDAGGGLVFQPDLMKAADQGRRGLIWAGKETATVREVFASRGRALLRLEDGFLRSRGLGAKLVAPLSLVVDDLGIYFDPTRESRLERILNHSDSLPTDALFRAKTLREGLIAAQLTKYNLGATAFPDIAIPMGKRRILVPGQVEDDASIRLGCGDIRTNHALLATVRAKNPDAFILYKPHPDVVAGLRAGALSEADILALADIDLGPVDAVSAIASVDEVWTMTSLLGFEALLRGKPVTCLGTPFYAGWGLTRDLGPPVLRRRARLGIDALVHGALIEYPRYFDPKTGLACPVEVVAERLLSGVGGARGPVLGGVSKVQGMLASLGRRT